jgi:hypothetical protein
MSIVMRFEEALRKCRHVLMNVRKVYLVYVNMCLADV